MQGSIVRICTSFIDVPGKIAVAIYFAGCSIRCSGCQNKSLWEASSGTMMDVDDIVKSIAQNPLAEAAVFLGGEPTDQMDVLIAVCERVNRAGAKDDVIEGDKAAGSYNKMMIADFAMSLSRKRQDKVNGTGRIHIMKKVTDYTISICWD